MAWCGVFAFMAMVAGPQSLYASDDPAALRETAIQQVIASSRSEDQFVRANAIEAAELLPDRLIPMVQIGLEDESPVVRFTAAAMIAKSGLRDLVGVVRPLLQDRSAHVRAAARAAVTRSGETVDLSPLAALLQSPDPGLRANTVMMLAYIGDPSAAAMIRDMAEVPLPATMTPLRGTVMRMQFAEAQVMLGDSDALEAIRAGMFSSFDEVRVLSTQMLGRLGDSRMEEAMFDILLGVPAPIDLRLAAMETLARTGGPATIREMLEQRTNLQEGATSGLPAIRAQTAHTLAQVEIARRKVLPTISPQEPPAIIQLFNSTADFEALVRLLSDESEQVRLSAAHGVLTVAAAVDKRPRRR